MYQTLRIVTLRNIGYTQPPTRDPPVRIASTDASGHVMDSVPVKSEYYHETHIEVG